ncbi:hypothetical protein Micbo1qcDRAFT_190661 [Microdochium bolleyi]|uniref:Potassium channel domain-containing protein n=1 Tax=Microdochium bolleyi TaxID=196109 RepID=A0A136IN01_9PEZI|nr:hypothetical protein Micbo1qcDRAFT_190661 [Microdochium bolleyi]
MDDYDAGKPISETCEAVDSKSPGQENAKGQDDAAQVDDAALVDDGPTRYWIISAAFPMIAGTLGPVASAFSICALVEKWRFVIPPGALITDSYPIQDPDFLYAINAVQLVIALIANLFLLLNMAKRVRFSIAQPITITGWFISAICLAALTATASGPLKEVQTDGILVWSQAFYYGMFAAVLYFIVACLMSVTMWGANAGHYSKDFKLTPSQRTLMLQTIMFLVYLLLGALLFSKIEGWDYLDAVYWADITLFTVGYGDFSPSTTLGRALLMPYALIGITSLGLVVGSIRSLVLDRGKTKLDARALEKKRRQSIRRLLRKEQRGILEPIDGEALVAFPELKGKHLPRSEFERRGAEFTLMRHIQARASARRRWTAMAISTSTLVVLWLVGAKIFEICEDEWQGWSYFDAFYFCFTGLTTIGYGDLSPISKAGRAFFVVWSLLALPTMTVLISNAVDTIIKLIRDGTLRLGNLTILPGEMGFTREAKMFLHKVTFGLVSVPETDTEISLPGFFGFLPRHHQTGSEADDNDDGEDSTEERIRARRDKLQRATDELHRQEKGKLPAGQSSNGSRQQHGPEMAGQAHRSRSEYHLTLIDEIRKVTEHLREKPARMYSYGEWAWYLRLLGEDEASAETHIAPSHPKRRGTLLERLNTRRASTICCKGKLPDNSSRNAHANEYNHEEQQPQATPAHGDHENEKDPVSPSDTAHGTDTTRQQQQHGEQKPKWSWVGTKSPLLDPRDEAQWILDRLQEKLRKELQAAATAQKRERTGHGEEPLSGAGAKFSELRTEDDPIRDRIMTE